MALDAIGGRKFILTCGCHLISSFLLLVGKLDSGSYTTIILATVGAYLASNVTQKVKAP
jgi:hypothetical protein